MSVGEFVFRTQSHLDPKWLKTSLLPAFAKGPGLDQLWNEMVKDGEVGIPLGSAEAAQVRDEWRGGLEIWTKTDSQAD